MLASLGAGAPVRMPKIDIDAMGRFSYVASFPPGKSVRALAIGLQMHGGHAGFYVFDRNGNCVAWDDSPDGGVPNDLAVEWVPSDASGYTIEIRNLARNGQTFSFILK
jgi:hypothetical protein